ncbi:TPA: DUF4406 domain-containing protein [Pseudomonas aeruginosa]
MNKANECTCPSGDGSLVHPCPAHPAVEQAVGDERAACNRWIAEQQLCQGSDISLFKLERNGALVSLHDLLCDAYQAGQARAALAQPSPAGVQLSASRERRIYIAGPMTGYKDCNFPAFNAQAEALRGLGYHVENPADHGVVDGAEWQDYLRYDISRLSTCEAIFLLPGWSKSKGAALEVYIAKALGMTFIHHADAEREQPSPAQAEQHWPKLEKPAQVGAIRFHAGLSSRLVVEAAQRLYEFESTPEKEAERIERLQAFREQLDPLNLAPHAEAFNEAPDEALRPEQAEAERPEVVAFRYHCTNAEGEPLPGWFYSDDAGTLGLREPLMTVAQHERIVEARWNRAMDLLLDHVSRISEKFKAERDAALARVAGLELGIARIAGDFLPDNSGQAELALDEMRQALHELLAAAPTQAQHSVPEEFSFEYRHPNGESHTVTVSRDQVINEMPDFLFEALCSKFCNCEPVGETNVVECCCDEYAEEFKLLAAAPGNSVPQAWLDVQAERRRQVTAEGWTPEHDDAHSHGQMARAAACYALAGSSAPNDGTAALLVSLAWPWDEQWWKPSTARRDLVKACALALAEIERLDRAGISQSPQPGATTASS